MSIFRRTLIKLVPFLMLLITLISCEEEEKGISLEGMSVQILSPQHNAGVAGVVEFIGFLHSDLPPDTTQLFVKWTSDKDGVLYDQQLTNSTYIRFSTTLSSNVHQITFEVNNGHGVAIHHTITVTSLIQLSYEATGSSVHLKWTAVANIKNFTLHRSDQDTAIPEDFPITAGQTSYQDTTAFLNRPTTYEIVGELNGQTIHSNTVVAYAGISLQLDYPLMKIVSDPKRNFVYGIISPESIYDHNKTGYGIVFINAATLKAEKRILEDVRFNDLDIDPEGDHLYVSKYSQQIYVIDLNTREVSETIQLENFIRKLDVGKNNRLYFHVEQAANNGYEFRIVDLVTKKELPSKFSGGVAPSFYRGDMEVDETTNIIYHSGPGRLKTSFDILSDVIGDDCCDAGQIAVFRNGKLFANENLYDANLNLIGKFIGENGWEERIKDCNAAGTIAIGQASLFNVNDRSIRKEIPAYYDKAIFLDNKMLMLVKDSNTEYERYGSLVYIYSFDQK